MNPMATNCRSQPQLKESSKDEPNRFTKHDFAQDVKHQANASLAESFGFRHGSTQQHQNAFTRPQPSTASGTAPSELHPTVDYNRIKQVLENNSRVVGSLKSSQPYTLNSYLRLLNDDSPKYTSFTRLKRKIMSEGN